MLIFIRTCLYIYLGVVQLLRNMVQPSAYYTLINAKGFAICLCRQQQDIVRIFLEVWDFRVMLQEA